MGEAEASAKATIRMLEEQFSLVMLSERMEESLVLLAHVLCLPLYRVAAFRKNARVEEEKVVELAPQLIDDFAQKSSPSCVQLKTLPHTVDTYL